MQGDWTRGDYYKEIWFNTRKNKTLYILDGKEVDPTLKVYQSVNELTSPTDLTDLNTTVANFGNFARISGYHYYVPITSGGKLSRRKRKTRRHKKRKTKRRY